MVEVDEVRATEGTVAEDLDLAALAFAGRLPYADEAERAELRAELIRRCLPFAGRLAMRYRGRGEPGDDLDQVARLGLVHAVDRYDPERGSFTAFAVSTISGELKRHFRDRTWGVHVPRRLQELSLRIGQATHDLTNDLSHAPNAVEIADHLSVPEAEVREAMTSAVGYAPASLSMPVGEDGALELLDVLGAHDDALEAVTDRVTVSRLLLRLPDRERRILALRFFGDLSQVEIAEEMGISQMHVSRLLTRSLTWLRAAMFSDVPPRWEGGGHEVPALHLSTRRGDGVLTVTIRGEIDRDAADRVRQALRHAVAVADGDRVVVDLAGTPLIDAAGVAVLTDAAGAARLAAVDVVLSGVQPHVREVLTICGLDTPVID